MNPMQLPELIICPINKVVDILKSGSANSVLSLLSSDEERLFYSKYKESVNEMLDYEFVPGNAFEGIENYVKEGDWKIVTMNDYIGGGDTKDIPDDTSVKEAIAFGKSKIDAGKKLIVHCQMGFSRSPAIAYLILCTYTDPQSAINEIYRIRPHIKPNKLIVEIGDRLLGLNGGAVKALEDRMKVKKTLEESFGGWYYSK